MTAQTIQKAYRLPKELAKRIDEVRARAEQAAGFPVTEVSIVVRLLELGLAAYEKQRPKK